MARKKRKGEVPVEELVAPDAFETVGSSGVQWLEKNFRYVLLGAGVILGAVLAFQLVASSQTRDSATMTAQLNEAVDAFSEAVDMRTVLTSTSPDTLNASYREVQKKLAAFRSQYPGEQAAALAGLYEAELLSRLDAPEQAATLYEGYLQALGDDAPLSFMAHEGAGYAYEKQGQLDRALKHFEKLGDYAYARGYALKHQARIFEAKKERERAQDLYRELKDLDEAGPLKTFAEERLQVLE